MPPRTRSKALDRTPDGAVDAAPGPRSSAIAQRRAAAREEGSAAYLERRREIVAAAARVFKQKGLQGSNLGDVAAAAGADRASLYYYVESKEELFHEVVRETVEANLRTARAIRDGDGTVPDKLRRLIESIMQAYASDYPILYVYLQENLSHVPERYAGWAADMRRVNREYEGVVVGLVEEGVADGSLRPVAPPWVVAYALLGMLGWTSRWFNPEGARASAEEIGAAFAELLLSGVVEPQRPRARARRPA